MNKHQYFSNSISIHQYLRITKKNCEILCVQNRQLWKQIHLRSVRASSIWCEGVILKKKKKNTKIPFIVLHNLCTQVEPLGNRMELVTFLCLIVSRPNSYTIYFITLPLHLCLRIYLGNGYRICLPGAVNRE